ncbi:uncharacterized protein LOC119557050 [Drosophila subpulchrella]|uniref:uncharacterized protein LOC119557050 n=1 Tax=Drosophila subpulchrella TaxID=1486046 RepID=UPI0018A192CF|nr:uncharacterized protein LOC119557050 [Drosophila subpulchrella]
MGMPASVLYSGSREGNFEGGIGFMNKIVLKVHQLIDAVFNRTEIHYDTGLVAGLVSIAVVIGACVIHVIMKRQKYQSIVIGAPLEEGDQVDPNLTCDETTEEEEAEDSGEADEEGEADTLMNEEYLEESMSDDVTDGSEELESNVQQDTLQTAEVPPLEIAELDLDEVVEVAAVVPEPRTKSPPKKKSGIKPVATMYSKEESYKVIPAREAGPMEPLNKLMTPRTLAAMHRTSVAVQCPAPPVPPPKPEDRPGSARRGRN